MLLNKFENRVFCSCLRCHVPDPYNKINAAIAYLGEFYEMLDWGDNLPFYLLHKNNIFIFCFPK